MKYIIDNSTILELASDIADKLMEADFIANDMGDPYIRETDEDGNLNLRYTDRAQDIFNGHYDDWTATLSRATTVRLTEMTVVFESGKDAIKWLVENDMDWVHDAWLSGEMACDVQGALNDLAQDGDINYYQFKTAYNAVEALFNDNFGVEFIDW